MRKITSAQWRARARSLKKSLNSSSGTGICCCMFKSQQSYDRLVDNSSILLKPRSHCLEVTSIPTLHQLRLCPGTTDINKPNSNKEQTKLPQDQCDLQGVMVHACSPNTWEIEAGEAGGQGHSLLHRKLQASLGYM